MRIGVIGCGKQAAKHIRALKSFSDIQILITDTNEVMGKDLAKLEDVQFVYDIHGVDAVFICTPPNSHYSLIAQYLGKKSNIFCEKPLCNSIDGAKVLEKQMLACHRFVQVGYVYRYAPVFEEAHRLLNESEVFGNPLFALFRLGGRGSHQEWKHKQELGGGVVNEMLVHMLDLALWFFGPLKIESSFLDNKMECRVIGENKVDCDADDLAFFKCKSNKGVDIWIESDMLTPAFSQYVEIQGTNGSFFGSIQPDVPSYLYLKEARGGYEAGKTIFDFGKRDFFAAQVTDFVYSVAVNKWPVKNTISDSILLMECLKGVELLKEE